MNSTSSPPAATLAPDVVEPRAVAHGVVESTPALADIAVIGGTGFYSWLQQESQVSKHHLSTPWGEPSAPISVAEVSGRRVAFLPRHGRRHQFGPAQINYRANLWALAAIGVTQVIAPCAVGGLQPDRMAPGDLLVPDQLVDRTTGRADTFVETGATHAPFADPYCARISAALHSAGARPAGAMVVIQGPRFSTRAESHCYARQGWELVNMTGLPEAALARELGLCYASLALVTDLDAGIAVGEGVSEAEVISLFAANLDRLGTVLAAAIASLPSAEGCSCSSWQQGLQLAYSLPQPEQGANR